MHPSKLAALLACGLVSNSAFALEYDFYGSLRFAAESVRPDQTANLDDYTGWRDAYSRLGVRASHTINDNVSAFATLELPLDLPNKAVQDPWDQSEDIRVAKVGIKGNFGSLSVGQMWMPYYNAIAYPVDMFSTYYSGFATFTSFRKSDTLSYYSPAYSGFSLGAGYSLENGATSSDGSSDDRLQATLSYQLDKTTFALGLDDLGGASNQQILGASVAAQLTDSLYIGAKYETFSSDLNSGYGGDGDAAANIYAGYTYGAHTFKVMLANVDNYGDQILHLGTDYLINNDLKLFIEYYREEETAAITTQHGGAAETCWSCSGGKVIAAGLRYDFASK